MGSVGDCFNNAMCESFFAALECELLDRHFRFQVEARMAVFEFPRAGITPIAVSPPSTIRRQSTTKGVTTPKG